MKNFFVTLCITSIPLITSTRLYPAQITHTQLLPMGLPSAIRTTTTPTPQIQQPITSILAQSAPYIEPSYPAWHHHLPKDLLNGASDTVQEQHRMSRPSATAAYMAKMQDSIAKEHQKQQNIASWAAFSEKVRGIPQPTPPTTQPTPTATVSTSTSSTPQQSRFIHHHSRNLKPYRKKNLMYLPVITRGRTTYNPVMTQEGIRYFPVITRGGITHNPVMTHEGIKHLPVTTRGGITYNPVMTPGGLRYYPV